MSTPDRATTRRPRFVPWGADHGDLWKALWGLGLKIEVVAVARRWKEDGRTSRVLVFAAYDAPEYVEAAIEAGAMGCLSKRRARSDLVAALDMLASGRMTFPAHVTGLLSKRRSTDRRRRERETLLLTAAGYTTDEIARKLHLSAKTVANYRASLKNKLGATTRVDLMRVVAESGHITDMLLAAGIGQADP